MMRRSLLVLLVLSCTLCAQQIPEIRYRAVPDFLHLPPDLYFGEVAGVAVNSKGHIFVFSRGNTNGTCVRCKRGATSGVRCGRQISA